jgi:hypothetical protein
MIMILVRVEDHLAKDGAKEKVWRGVGPPECPYFWQKESTRNGSLTLTGSNGSAVQAAEQMTVQEEGKSPLPTD